MQQTASLAGGWGQGTGAPHTEAWRWKAARGRALPRRPPHKWPGLQLAFALVPGHERGRRPALPAATWLHAALSGLSSPSEHSRTDCIHCPGPRLFSGQQPAKRLQCWEHADPACPFPESSAWAGLGGPPGPWHPTWQGFTHSHSCSLWLGCRAAGTQGRNLLAQFLVGKWHVSLC